MVIHPLASSNLPSLLSLIQLLCFGSTTLGRPDSLDSRDTRLHSITQQTQSTGALHRSVTSVARHHAWSPYTPQNQSHRECRRVQESTLFSAASLRRHRWASHKSQVTRHASCLFTLTKRLAITITTHEIMSMISGGLPTAPLRAPLAAALQPSRFTGHGPGTERCSSGRLMRRASRRPSWRRAPAGIRPFFCKSLQQRCWCIELGRCS